MIMADDSTVGDKNNNIPDVQAIYSYPSLYEPSQKYGNTSEY